MNANYFAPKWWLYVMIWLPGTTDNSTYFSQSLEIRGIESRLYFYFFYPMFFCYNTTMSAMFSYSFSSSTFLEYQTSRFYHTCTYEANLVPLLTFIARIHFANYTLIV